LVFLFHPRTPRLGGRGSEERMATRRRSSISDGKKAQASATPRMGRPALDRERVVKTAVVLLARQIGALDRLALDIRDASGKATTRSDVLRGIVDGVLSSGLDLSKALSETEIRDDIAARLRR